MTEYVFYYPILKWKQGEYKALHSLTPQIKDRICPIIEITPIGYDPESKENRITIDEHIKDIGIRLRKYWEDRTSFIDTIKLDAPEEQKPAYVNKIFDNCFNSFCRVIPVVHLKDSDQLLKTYKEIIKKHRYGCMLRVNMNEIADDIADKVRAILEKLDTNATETYLLADFDVIKIGDDEVYDIYSEQLCKIFNIFDWHTTIIAGSSFPEEMTDGTLNNRYEWNLYDNFLKKFAITSKEPKFSDYYILNPEHSFPHNGKIIKPKAKLRYTTNNGWYFNKIPPKSKRNKDIDEVGKELTEGEKYKFLCKDLIANSIFRGPSFSKGDEYIYKQATDPKAKGGNASIWVEASTNQHLTKVVNDLSKLLGFSLRCEQGLLGLLERTLE